MTTSIDDLIDVIDDVLDTPELEPATYEMVDGTEPTADETHEPRTIEQKRKGSTFHMMSEIDDGVFVAWTTCAQCVANVSSCECPDGPAEPGYIERWRKERFEAGFAYRIKARNAAKNARSEDAEDAEDAESLVVEIVEGSDEAWDGRY